MSDSDNKRPMFEFPKEQPQRRPRIKKPDLKPEVDNEIPEGFENAVSAIKMQQEASNKPSASSPPLTSNEESATSELVKPELIKPELIKPELIKPELIKPEDIKPEDIKPIPTEENQVQSLEGKSVKEIIAQLKKKQRFEEVMLPSRCFLYGKYGAEPDKPIHVRPMTIEEEKIISTPRLIRSGQAIDKIFESCIYENIPPGKLLSIDRTFLLFYIRGISYGPDYEIDVKCPSCDTQFSEEINLDALPIEMCKDDFTGEISCTLPGSELAIRYKIPTGDDERTLSRHRDMMIRGGFRSDAPDDTLVRRNIMLITNIEGITSKIEIEQIVNNLGVKDSNYLRDQISNPYFGILTDVGMHCEYCYHEWELDLPIDVNFFFPRTKRTS